MALPHYLHVLGLATLLGMPVVVPISAHAASPAQQPGIAGTNSPGENPQSRMGANGNATANEPNSQNREQSASNPEASGTPGSAQSNANKTNLDQNSKNWQSSDQKNDHSQKY